MGFAPNNILYKSPTSIGLENRETTPNEKKKNSKKKLASITRKRETLNNPNMQLKCHPCYALIPIDEF